MRPKNGELIFNETDQRVAYLPPRVPISKLFDVFIWVHGERVECRDNLAGMLYDDPGPDHTVDDTLDLSSRLFGLNRLDEQLGDVARVLIAHEFKKALRDKSLDNK